MSEAGYIWIMGQCFGKKSKDKDCIRLNARNKRSSRSCTPDPVCASIEIILEDSEIKNSKLFTKSCKIDDYSSNQSTKLLINSIHRSKRPREDIKEVQTEILKVTRLVEDTLKKTESCKNIEKSRGKVSSEKLRSKSWVKKQV